MRAGGARAAAGSAAGARGRGPAKLARKVASQVRVAERIILRHGVALAVDDGRYAHHLLGCGLALEGGG